MRNVRRVRYLTSLRVTDQDARMIKQQTGCSIQFNFGLFVCCFGGNKRHFGLGHGRLILQD